MARSKFVTFAEVISYDELGSEGEKSLIYINSNMIEKAYKATPGSIYYPRVNLTYGQESVKITHKTCIQTKGKNYYWSDLPVVEFLIHCETPIRINSIYDKKVNRYELMDLD